MEPGDIVRIYAPTVGYHKYHLCLSADGTDQLAQFLFMSSEPGFSASLDVPCNRVPCIPPSKTGYTCISLNRVPRHSAHQLNLFQAQVMGAIDQPLATDLHTFALGSGNMAALPQGSAAFVRQVLESLARKPTTLP